MAKTKNSVPSFLRDAFESYAQYTAEQKQDAQQRALKWLQTHIESDLPDKSILTQFARKWRTGSNAPSEADDSNLNWANLPSSYKGNKSINSHQEEALKFLEETIPQELQDDFKTRWEVKTKLKVSNASGTPFKVDETDLKVLQENDPNGEGKKWYQVNKGDVYYLLSSEEKDDHYLIVTTEEIGSEDRNTWYVSKEDVNISGV
ncbi:hypothetical protein [Cyanothece sp. BG0011]|uniref:hypothetical protein n=1 Tax=Cyanothece sp. BG0011 TaxID=2082950 RepID=UPI000D1E86D3|nr:hypothetical protein [Cyanothece sp. BG0011]